MKRAYRCMAVLMTLMMLLAMSAAGVALAGPAPDGTIGCCAGGDGAGGGAGVGATGGGGDGAAAAGGGGSAGAGAGSGGAAGFLTPAQEHTYDTFNACAAGYVSARIDRLAPDGSFTFSTGMTNDSYAIKACMSQQGFKFDW